MRNRRPINPFKLVLGLGAGWLAFVIGIFALVALWTERSLDWLFPFVGKEVDVPYWAAFLITFIINAVAIPFNIIIEIIRAFAG